MRSVVPYQSLLNAFYFAWLLSLFLVNTLQAQEEEKRQAWKLKGYLKELGYISFDQNFKNHSATVLVHNRINIKWTPHERISGAAEFRTRMFWGDDVRRIPNFAEQLQNKNEQVRGYVTWFESSDVAMLTNIERFWIEYKASKWALRAGRQRINWGVATTWNPNDIFNTYNFLDFDYEERPGSDAVKVQYFPNELSNVDVAVSPSFSNQTTVVASRYFWNRNQYDWQVIAGWYHGDFTAGVGWAGSIDDVGFKGEVQYFEPNNYNKSQLNAMLEWDYMFNKGWYINTSFLYNNLGFSKSIDDWTKVSFNLSPRNLMPTAYNIMLSTRKEITPLIATSVGLVYAPGTNMAIILPSIQYSLSDQWDVNLVWQSFYVEMNQSFEAVSYRIFLRAKWNF